MAPALRTISLRLETVTPMYTGGAAYQPELRPPSMRGLMRFWLRALLGGTLGEDLGPLRQVEAAVFGDAQRASPVGVRIDEGEVRTGPISLSAEEFPGVAYMFWSVEQRRREAILPGGTFQLLVQRRPWAFSSTEVSGATLDEDDVFHLAAAALWLLVRLGGAGARVRRGGGGLRAAAPPSGWPQTVPSPLSQATAPDELASELGQGLQAIRRSLPWQSTAERTLSSFDILHPEVCQIFVADRCFPTWWEAADWVGRQWLEFRRSHKGDASAIAELLTRGRMAANTIHRAVLGLPLMFFFKSIFTDLTQRGVPPREARRKASATIVPNRRLGRASPLMFRVVPLATDPPQYTVVLSLFRSRFLPDRQLTIRPQDRSIRPATLNVPSNYDAVDRWFDFVRGEGVELRAAEFALEDEHA